MSSRKPFKHSKRFERTQKGCLTCRQKKKKCDGEKPICHSCSKRGLDCKYPENIRIFNVDSFQTSKFSVKTDSRSNSLSDFEFKEHVSALSPHASATSVSSQQSSQPSPPPRVSRQSQQHVQQQDDNISRVIKSNTEVTNNAISLSKNGESIKQILDNIAIDVIKRSIESLQYIDLEKRISKTPQEQNYSLHTEDHAIMDAHHNHDLQNWAIMEGLKFKDEESAGHPWLDDDFLKVQDHIV